MEVYRCIWFACVYVFVYVCMCAVPLTSEDGTELSPAGDASLRSKLAQSHLQEEHRQTSPKQEDGVGDEKSTWV